MMTDKPENDAVFGDSRAPTNEVDRYVNLDGFDPSLGATESLSFADRYGCRDDSPSVEENAHKTSAVDMKDDLSDDSPDEVQTGLAEGADDAAARPTQPADAAENLETVAKEVSEEDGEDGLVADPDKTADAAATFKSGAIDAGDATMKTLKDCYGADGQWGGAKEAIAMGLATIDTVLEKVAFGVDWCHRTCVEAKVCNSIGDLELAASAPKTKDQKKKDLKMKKKLKKVATVTDDLEAFDAGDVAAQTREDCGVEGRTGADEPREGGIAAVKENRVKETIDSVAKKPPLATIPESSGKPKKSKLGSISPFKSMKSRKWGKGRKGAGDDLDSSVRSNMSRMSNMSNVSGMLRTGIARSGISRKSLGFKKKVPPCVAIE